MKKLLFTFLLLLPSFAFATPTTWDFTNNILQPLQSMWTREVKVNYLTATSTTATSTFSSASTSRFSVSNTLNLFGTIGTALSDFCIAITGGSGLCDGTDATGGGGGGSISTSSIPTAGNLAYWTSGSTLSDVATGTLTENVTGLELSATRGLVGGSAILSLTNGYTVPTTSSTTEWGSFYQTPSTRITDGTGLTWSSNTLNCDTASGSTQGCITSIDWTSFNGRVSSTSIDTLSELETLQGGINIIQSTEINTSALLAGLLSDETGGAGSAVFSVSPTLTGLLTTPSLNVTASSTLGFASSTALTISGTGYFNFASSSNASTTNLNVHSNLRLGSLTGMLKATTGLVSTASNGTDFTLITGTTCGGTDKVSAISASGVVTCSADVSGSGGTQDWIRNTGLDGLTPTTTTLGIVIHGSSTVTNLSSTNATATNATTTNLNVASSFSLFGGGAKTTNNDLCIQLTGSAALCDGDDASGGGGGVSDWNQSILAGVLSPSTTIGIRVAASSTILGALSVASTSPDYNNPILKVSTSSSIFGTLFNVMATSSLMGHTSSLRDFPQETGARLGFGGEGYYGLTQQLDQTVLYGRLRNPNWFTADCAMPVGGTQIVADGVTGCSGFVFGEQGTETLTAVAGNGYAYGQLGGAVANESAAFTLNGASAGWIRLATSTPSFEVTARIGTIAANSSTTKYVIGYHNLDAAAPGTGAEPSAGCFFIASTTQANWIATCRTAAGTGTVVNTGISSTTITTGAGAWRTFRIDADADNALFFIKNGTSSMALVANISTTYPSNVALNAGVTWQRTTGTQAIQFDFFGVNAQWRRFTPEL